MAFGFTTRSYRHVVRAGKARHTALGDCCKSSIHEFFDIGYDVGLEAMVYVRRVSTVYTDDCDRPVRVAVG